MRPSDSPAAHLRIGLLLVSAPWRQKQCILNWQTHKQWCTACARLRHVLHYTYIKAGGGLSILVKWTGASLWMTQLIRQGPNTQNKAANITQYVNSKRTMQWYFWQPLQYNSWLWYTIWKCQREDNLLRLCLPVIWGQSGTNTQMPTMQKTYNAHCLRYIKYSVCNLQADSFTLIWKRSLYCQIYMYVLL